MRFTPQSNEEVLCTERICVQNRSLSVPAGTFVLIPARKRNSRFSGETDRSQFRTFPPANRYQAFPEEGFQSWKGAVGIAQSNGSNVPAGTFAIAEAPYRLMV